MEKRTYDHQRIEKKWQTRWEDRQLFKAEVDLSKPKYYILDMFPYPSGAGLHVGHVTGYTATDILARYKRQMGFNVLHPMGWDSFGLPAEQYAIRTGTHPKITTEKNIHTYRRQLKSLGLSYDWSREIATSDPKYYKWTQWIFTKLFEKGLAYEAEMQVNFCPALGTVLANEEVEEGFSKEGGHPIERRPLRQWVLKITTYADRLLQDLDQIDWPESLKKLQVNWIGKSEGAKVHFIEQKTSSKLTVFTTRADTLFGVTYMVLAPEHPLIAQIVTQDQRAAVDAYQRNVLAKSDLERTDLNKEKNGVWTGAYAVNPVNQQLIPIWISDFVLMHYGTGAVMAVPAHDERDFEFAKKYDLPIIPVVEPSFDKYPYSVPEGLHSDDVKREVLKGSRCWIENGVMIGSTYGSLSINGLDVEAAKRKIIGWLEESQTGERTVHYKLRDWLFSRQRYWGEPFPILHFADGTKRALTIDELPLSPPHLCDFKPSETGESPLAKVKEWIEIVDLKTGKKALRESNTMPQWAGSCWYYLRFCDPHNEDAAWGQVAENYWMPVDLYVGGVEHAVLHLLYARFWHKVLFDCGLVSTIEPFQVLRNQGLLVSRSYQHPNGGYVPPEEVEEKEGKFFQIGTHEELHSQMEKMSKSKLNGVTPDEMIEDVGADTLRLYEMFMGPFDKEKVWNTDAATGCRRFLSRVYDIVFSEKVTDEETEEALKLGHRLVAVVGKDIEAMQFNTAIAKMMEFINAFVLLPSYPKSVVKMLIQVLYPFAPHIAEEAWEHFGGKESLTYLPFPQADVKYLVDDTVLYVVQVNGRLRGKWMLPKDKDQEELMAFIQLQPLIAKHIVGPISKVVYVPNKLINIVCDVDTQTTSTVGQGTGSKRQKSATAESFTQPAAADCRQLSIPSPSRLIKLFGCPIFYNLCLAILGLIALPKLLWQMCVLGKYRKTLFQRLGWKLPPAPSKPFVIWIHTVSVGETRAVIPLFRLLKQHYPEAMVYISTTTETGHREALTSLPEADSHFILPLDFSWIMRRLCKRIQPKMLILVESDFWYQLLFQAQHTGASVFLVNGKVSEKSKRHFQWFPDFTRQMFAQIDHLCVQSQRFADRFMEMGIDRKKINVTGNLKFDAAVIPLTEEDKHVLKRKLKIQEEDRLIVIGSTHHLEEERLLRALSSLFHEIPHLKIVIVPRHPERFSAVATHLKSLKISYGLFSQSEALTGKEQVILIDTMGELNRCYQLAQIAIVGGSFIEHVGGHNILEPAFFQVPTLFGPEMYGQLDLVDLVLQAEAGLQVTLAQLPSIVRQWLTDSDARERYRQGARLLLSQIRGSSERTVQVLIAFQKKG